MVAEKRKIDLPSSDKRWKIVEATMRRHGYSQHALIETLHSTQESFGYLDEVALKFVAKNLSVPLSKVYGVATFYHYFSLKPQGEHTCVVCMGTACYIKGAPEIVAAIEGLHAVKHGNTSADGKLSLVLARCIGSCGLAPALVFDGEVVGRLDKGESLKRVATMLAKPAAMAAGAN